MSRAPPRKTNRNSLPASTQSCDGAASDLSAADAPWPPTGVPGKPNLFYIGVNNGGVWKTTDYRPHLESRSSTGSPPARSARWRSRLRIPTSFMWAAAKVCGGPIFPPATAFTNPPTRGKTWTASGPARRPADHDIRGRPAAIPIAFSWRCWAIPTGPTPSAAFFVPPTAAQTWQKILYKDENTGATDLAFDPDESANPLRGSVVGAPARRGPPAARSKATPAAFSNPPMAATPGSRSPRVCPPTSKGLGRIGIGIAPSDPNRMYALVDAQPEVGGLYRSDDAGESWQRVNHEERIWGRGSDFAWVRVDPEKQGHDLYLPTLPPTARPMPAQISPRSKARRAATIITPSGSIPKIRRSFCWPATRARPSASTAARPGVPGTTSRPRSSITSSPTTNFPTGFTAASRKAARRARPAAATGAKSRSAIGIRWAPKNTDTSRRTRCIPNLIYGGKVTRFDIDHRPDAGRLARDLAHREIPLQSHRAADVFAGRAAHAVSRLERGVQDHRRRAQLADHQPRSDARRSRRAGESGRPDRERSGERQTSRRDLFAGAFAA